MFSYNHGYQSSCAYDAKHWQTLWSVALNYKRQSTHTCSILPFFSVNSSVVISTAEGGGMGIKVRNRHWHGRVRSVLWLATASCVHPRGFFFRGRTAYLTPDGFKEPADQFVIQICWIRGGTYILHQVKFEDNRSGVLRTSTQVYGRKLRRVYCLVVGLKKRHF